MKPGGIIHLKTDSPVLYEYTLEQIEEHKLRIEECSADVYGELVLRIPPEEQAVMNIRTFYESMWLEEGRTMLRAFWLVIMYRQDAKSSTRKTARLAHCWRALRLGGFTSMKKRTIQNDAVQERDFFADVMDVVRQIRVAGLLAMVPSHATSAPPAVHAWWATASTTHPSRTCPRTV